MSTPLDPTEFNRAAWDRIAADEDKWFHAATEQEIELARSGTWKIKLTPTRDVPRRWFGDIQNRKVLCLAAAGGQQAPILAAAGALVTVVDNSERQLARDTRISSEFGLNISTVVADMRDLGAFPDDEFDLIVNPTSVCYVENLKPVWIECARVLKNQGSLLAGFINPINFLFDPLLRDRGKLRVQYKIPYSDFDLADDAQEKFLGPHRPIEFGHPLEQLIGGQIEAGLAITGFFTDRWGDSDALSDLIDVFGATKATKFQAAG